MSRRYRLPVFTEEILDQIIWGMENQDSEYSLNIQDGSLYSPDSSDETIDEEYLVELPPWKSSDGYQIMVSFTNSCKDQKLQRRLINELNSKSHGVFRRFRDILSEDPETLKLWYDFKDGKMKSFIRSWYRRNYGRMTESERESGDDELPVGELLANFEIDHINELDDYCTRILEDYSNDSPIKAKILSAFNSKQAFTIKKGTEECGALIYEIVGKEACILYYYVEPQYRRMGLFSLTFDLFNREMERGQIERVSMPFGQESLFFKQVFGNYEVPLKPVEDTLLYNIKDWNEAYSSAEFAYVL